MKKLFCEEGVVRMSQKRGGMIALKGALAICLLINNFSSFGAIVKAMSVESEDILNSEVSGDLSKIEESLPEETLENDEIQKNDEISGEEIEKPDEVMPEQNPNDGENVNPGDEGIKNSEVADEMETNDSDNIEKYTDNYDEISDESKLIDLDAGEALSIESRSSGSGLVQLWQEVVPGQEWKENKSTREIMSALQCRPNHDLYPISGGSSHQTYVNSCYVDDALYLGEDDQYFYIYLAGYQGKVLKTKTHKFTADLNEDGTKVEYEINTIARFIPGTSAKALTEEVETLDVPFMNYATDTLNKDFSVDIEEGIAPISDDEKISTRSETVKSPSYYANENGTLVHYLTRDVRNTSYTKSIVGKAPIWMQSGVRYYSYDGIYFYLNWQSIRPDGSGAYNASQPFYNYYQYLPFRSKTQYSATDIDNYTTANGYYSTSKSRLVNTGQYFATAQESFGTNAALQYAMGIHESDWGTSAISLNKNNLFGVGANDGNPYGDAQGYPSVENGIFYHAERYLSWGYSDPDDWRYFGSHVGNKASGMNVRYASDPFWGEKIAGWYYRFDQASGGVDHNYYTIGINPAGTTVNVKATNSASSSTLYQTKNKSYNILNYPVLITGVKGGFYQIKTDIALNSNGKPQYNATYDWGNSYGYIPTSTNLILNNTTYNDPNKSGAMSNHVDGLTIGSNGILTIDGWGIVDGFSMNTPDSVLKELIIINNTTGSEQQRITLTNLYGTDLSMGYQKPFDYARYTGMVNLKDLPSGAYDLKLTISNKNLSRTDVLRSNNHITTIEVDIEGRHYSITNAGMGEALTLRIYDVPIQNHVDSMQVTEQAIFNVYGWAMYDGVNLNDKNNIQKELIFRNTTTGEDVKRVTLTDVYSTDLSDWNQRPLDYARYNGDIDLSQLPSGEYMLLINIRVGNVNKLDVLKSNYALTNIQSNARGRNFTLSNTGEGTGITLRIQDLPIQNHVDSIEVTTNGHFKAYGWAFYEGANLNDKDSVEKEIIFRNTTTKQDVIRETVQNVYSTDLSDWSQAKYDYARYNGIIDIRNIPSGEYQLLINVRTGDLNKLDALKSNYTLLNISTVFEGRRYTLSNTGEGTGLYLLVQDLPIQNHVDSMSIDSSGNFNVYGWAFYDGVNLNNENSIEKEIIFRNKSTNQDRIRETVSNIYSTDLSDWSHAPLNYARYDGRVDITSLPKGEYLILINIRTGSVNKLDALKSNYALTNIVSYANGKTYTLSNTGEGTAITLKIS